jgi:hypothetical protein
MIFSEEKSRAASQRKMAAKATAIRTEAARSQGDGILPPRMSTARAYRPTMGGGFSPDVVADRIERREQAGRQRPAKHDR